MAKILFIMDAEEGHILPSFGLAQSLKKRKHEIGYLTVLDNAELVREQGFEMIPILEHIYYKGYKEKYRKLASPPGVRFHNTTLVEEYNAHIAELMDGYYDNILNDFQADLVVVSAFLGLDSLILYYKYHIATVIFTPFLRRAESTPAKECFQYLNNTLADEMYTLVELALTNGWNIDSLSDLVKPLDTFYELIACPYELEVGNNVLRENLHYIEPSIRKKSTGQNVYDQYKIPAHKKIIYASMGSQPVRHGVVCDIFFGKLINIMRSGELDAFHMILSVGPEYETNKLEPVPGNVTVARWVSQIDILKVASLAITHGGLGSVKECIYHGVPMIVLPLGYDQPDNANRVQHHQLGISWNIETVTEHELKTCILKMVSDSNINERVKKMQQVFQEKEAANVGAAIIESLLLNKQLAIS
jgi:zeaxanthin glucosyltransferase